MKNCSKYKGNLNVTGKIIREKRIEKNMSLEELSGQLLLKGVNIPITSLHRIENNQRTVRDYEICALAKVLKIEVLELLQPFLDVFDSKKN